MWRRLLGHCQALAGDDATWRRPAAAALGDDAFLDGACCHAILDGASAREALTACFDLLSGDLGVAAQGVDCQALRRRIARAQLGILVCLAGEGEVPRADFLPWLSCLLNAAPSERREPSAPTLAGWDCLGECLLDFPNLSWVVRDGARDEVRELVSRARYGAIAPRGAEEHSLLSLLRQMPLFPPVRFDRLPETGDVPDDYALASRLLRRADDVRAPHLGQVMELLGSSSPRVRVVSALLFDQLTPHSGPRWFNRDGPRQDITEGERQLTLQLTNDPHPVLRRVAVRRLGALYQGQADPVAVDAVVPHLRDPSPPVRVEAARSVAKLSLGDAVPAALDGLLAMLHEEAEPSLAAALEATTTLGEALTERHIDRVLTLLPHPSPLVARNAAKTVEAAGTRAGRPEVAEAILDLFRHPGPEVREAALLAYGALRLPPNDRGLDELGRVLSSDPEVEAAALAATQCLGRHAATHAVFTGLIRLLRKGYVKEALAALEAMGPAAMRDDVFAALSDQFDSAWGDRARAILTTARRLGPSGFRRMMGLVVEKLGDPDARVRRLAVLVLGDLREEAATPQLLAKLPPLLDDPLAGVRESAALAIELIGPASATKEIVLRLARLKHDPDRDVRFRAEDALYRLTGQR